MKQQYSSWQRLHIGASRTVAKDTILGIFDMDTATISTVTRKFLNTAEKRGEVVLVCEELPKSFVITAPSCEQTVRTHKKERGAKSGAAETTVYLSQLSPATLAGRDTV